MVKLHEEADAIVVDVRPWGRVLQLLSSGQEAFLDNTQNAFWRDGEPGPEIGEGVRVVVLDDEVVPVRVSSLAEDFNIAAELRKGA